MNKKEIEEIAVAVAAIIKNKVHVEQHDSDSSTGE